MAKKQPEQIERMAGSIPHPGRRIALEIVTLLLFILFMLPFVIVIMNSMRTNAEIINAPVALPENPANLFQNISDVWNNPTFNFLSACRDSLIITVLSLAAMPVGLSKEDSLTLVRDFIDSWVKEKLVLHEAEKNLTPREKNFEMERFEVVRHV